MRRTQRQASRAALTHNEEVELSNSIYKKALKEATTLVRAGGTLRKTMDAMNEKHELKGANKLTKSTIHNYMKKELVGASSLRRGRQTQVPRDFMNSWRHT